MKDKRKPRLIQDSREQLPLTFNADKFHEVVVEGLPVGDYVVEIWTGSTWQQVPFAVDRKSLNDLYGTMTSGYDRWKRCMERAKESGCHLVLAIEETMTTVHSGCKYSTFTGDSMLKKLAMLEVRYDLEVRYFNGRREMSRWIEEIADAMQRNYSHSSATS